MGRKQNEEFESPREPTAQEKENNDQHVVSESTKEGLLSNQVTENTNNANIPPSVKTLEIGQKGVDSEPKDNNSALVETSPKAKKRMPPSGRGRGNFAPTFPGKDRSTPNGSFRLHGQNVDGERKRCHFQNSKHHVLATWTLHGMSAIMTTTSRRPMASRNQLNTRTRRR